MRKRIFSVMLAVVMVLTTVDITAFAQEETSAEMQITETQGEQEEAEEQEEPAEEKEEITLAPEVTESSSASEETKTTEDPSIITPSVTSGDAPEEGTYSIENEVATEFAGGTGTKEDPYQIENLAQLNLFVQWINSDNKNSRSVYYKLIDDIYLNYSLEDPVNKWDHVNNFYANFDGDGHTLFNLYIVSETKAYDNFGMISGTSSSTITNLTVENARIECKYAGGSATGGIIADSTYGLISNCMVRGDITVTGNGYLYVGGIAGTVGNAENCIMAGNLKVQGNGTTTAAGIAYKVTGSVKSCETRGSITVDGGSNFNAGAYGIASDCSGEITSCFLAKEALVITQNGTAAGIVGNVSGGQIHSCNNFGTVSASSRASGIVNYISNGTVSQCGNEGNVQDASFLSGIVSSVSVSKGSTVAIAGCTNKADMLSSVSNAEIDGIVASISTSGTGAVEISNCVNEGALTGYSVRGIAGTVQSKETGILIAECYNEGKLTAENSAAGIAGYLGRFEGDKGEILVRNCYNKGEIAVNGSWGGYTGGIAAYSTYARLVGCYNVGKLSATGSVGGIVDTFGFYGTLEHTQITGCFNLGEIIAGDRAAGIAVTMNKGKISSCYNLGKIVIKSSTGSSGEVAGLVSNIQTYAETGEAIGEITDCFNCGNISIECDRSLLGIGGIAGWACPSGANNAITIRNCYNVGQIAYSEKYSGKPGAIFGSIYVGSDGGTLTTENLYYQQGELDAVASNSENISLSTTALSESEMKQTGSYKGFDFTDIWKKGTRKYEYPILRGVGEEYLVYNYAGGGQDTIFGEYLLRVVDLESGDGVSRATITYRDKTVTSDSNGIIRILTADPALGSVSVSKNQYFDNTQEITLKTGEAVQIPIERKKEIKISKVAASDTPHVEAGETEINGDTASALNTDFPIKINLNFKPIENSFEEGNTKYADTVPVKVEWVDKTKVKLTIGIDSKATYKDDYSDAKSMLEKWEELNSDFVLKEMKKFNPNAISGKFGTASAKVYTLGYMTLDFSGGTPKLVESQMAIGLEGEGSITYRPAWAGTVAYGTFKLNPKLQGSMNSILDEELGSFEFTSKLDITIPLTVAVGIGYDFAKGEVGAVGTAAGSVNLKKGWDVNEDLKINLSAVPYAMLHVGFFEISTNYKGWNVQLWPWGQKSARELLQSASKENACTIMNRDYLKNASAVERLQTASQDKRASAGLDMDGVYPLGEPQIVSTTEGTRIAVWVADNGSKASADRTTLYYAVIEGDVLTYMGPVCETGRGDYSPRLLAKGDSIYVVYMNADKEYGESTTYEEYLSNMSLYVSSFNGTAFGEPVKVTKEGNHLPLLTSVSSNGTGVTITWVENSVDNAFLAEGTNNIYSRQYAEGKLSEIKEVAKNLPVIYGMDSGYVEGVYSVVWSQDMDGDVSTGKDAELYVMQNGVVSRLTDNAVEDNYVRLSGNDLYYSADGMIRRMPTLDKNRSESTGVACTEPFNVLWGEAGRALLWLEKDGFATIPVVSYEKGGGFTEPVPLEGFDGVSISSYSADYEEDGSISMLYDVAEVLGEWTEGESPYGETNMRYTGKLKASNLLVDDYLYYNTMETVPGGTLTFETDVTNLMGQEIKTMHLTLKAGEETVKEETVEMALAPGQMETVSVEYILPEQITPEKYTLTVTAPEMEENDLSDNQASAFVGFGNLKLADTKAVKNEDGTVSISGSILNDGYQAVNGKTLILRAGGQQGEEIERIENISLPVGEKQDFALTAKEGYAGFDYAYDVAYFYLSVEGEDQETNYADNSQSLIIRPVLAESIDLEGDVQLQEGESHALQVTVAPSEAYTDYIFTSSNLSVASVDGEGVVTALSAGEAVITAVTGGGKVSASCRITVSPKEESESGTIYSMGSETETMEPGETVLLEIFAEADPGEDVIAEPIAFTWKSSDETVAAVAEETVEASSDIEEEGNVAAQARVQALQEGSAVITAISEKGDVVSCIAIVEKTSVKFVAFEKESYTMNKGESLNLQWESRPEGAEAADFTFISSEEGVAVVDNKGTVQAISQGSTKIIMTYQETDTDAEPVKAVCLIEVTDPALTTYDVFFDSNGGNRLPEGVAFQTGESGHVFEFPETPTRPGYYFGGWNEKADGTGKTYSGTESLRAGEEVTGSLVLYALWVSQAEGLWAAEIPDQVYTGSPIKPKAAVYDGTKLLKEGVDYTLTYKNNTNVAASHDTKAPTVTVKGKGNYTGSQTVLFTILPRNIETGEGLEADDILVKANGKVQQPVPVVRFNGKVLKNKKDFKVSYPEQGEGAYKEPGTYEVVITGIGGYRDSARSVTMTVTEANLISKVQVAKIPNQPYDEGNEVEPPLVVTFNKNRLEEKIDYTVTYENNTEIGTATAVIHGIGNYVGEKKVNFKITGGTVKNAVITGIPKSVVYSGKDITFKVKKSEDEVTGDKDALDNILMVQVKVNGEWKELYAEKDFTVTYTNNRKKGRATILFTGINGYTGSIKKTFDIKAYDIKDVPESEIQAQLLKDVLYEKGGSMPKPTVTFGDDKTLLTEKVDYTLSYKNNTKLNDGSNVKKLPTVTIKGKGNFTGSRTLDFTIREQDIGKLHLKAADKVFSKKADGFKSTPVITDLNGKTLKAGTDYEKAVTYTYAVDTELSDGTIRKAGEMVQRNDAPKAGTEIVITAKGKGNYIEGSIIIGSYRIVAGDISKAKVSIPAQTYTGQAIEPDDKITVKDGTIPLTLNEDYTLSYSNNVNKGTAEVTITGIKNYGNVKKVKFSIKSKKITWWKKLFGL